MKIRLTSTKHFALAIGLFGLMALAITLPEEKIVSAGEISSLENGEKILITGKIKQLSISNGNAFFELENNGTVKTVYFNPKQEQLALLRENSMVLVHGQTATYKGEPEIIAREVKAID